MTDKLRVYISFAQEDRPEVRQLEAKLRSEGFETWFDEKDLTAGSDWKEEIKHALPRSDVFLSCLSTRSVGRKGFYNEEMGVALELRKQRPNFVVPVRLDKCEVPPAYREANLIWVDLFGEEGTFDEGGVTRLVNDLKKRAAPRPAARAPIIAPDSPLIRILHLSDLHFGKHDDHKQLLNILDEDLPGDVDYLVVSGDLSDRCNETGYQHAAEFLGELQTLKSIPQERCVLVPGNHDVRRDLASFEIREKIEKSDDAVRALAGDLETIIYLVRKDCSYADRFDRFAAVHKQFTGRDYDLNDPEKQVSVVVSEKHRLQFLCLNSAWEIDQFRPKRASIHSGALDSGLKSLRLRPGYLGVAVWHHAITGNDKILNDRFLGRLCQSGVRLCLHGDVHELRPDVVSPYDPNRIHVVGTGAFGAGPADRPASTPRMYNLIEISDDRKHASVSTRQQSQPGMPFQAYATWSKPGQRDVRTGRYEFAIDPP